MVDSPVRHLRRDGLVFGLEHQGRSLSSGQGRARDAPFRDPCPRRLDCEGNAILAASILKVMGHETALLFVPGHAALGVAGAEGIPGVYAEKDGLRYYYCEMTRTEWKVGLLPEPYEPGQIEVHTVPGLEARVVSDARQRQSDPQTEDRSSI